MTDEEKTKESIEAYWSLSAPLRQKIVKILQDYSFDAYLVGLKAGRPQWHDLRKDPNDLPNGDRVVLNQVGMATRYDPNRGFLGLDGIGVIAWCEIPKFEENE